MNKNLIVNAPSRAVIGGVILAIIGTLLLRRITQAKPFDPWTYDVDRDGDINSIEVIKARDDYYANAISYPEMEQVFQLYMDTCKEWPAIEVVDFDFNEDGIIDRNDEAAFLAVYGSVIGNPLYQRKFDANFDGIIDDADYDLFKESLGLSLSSIRANAKLGIYQCLMFPTEYGELPLYLSAINKDNITKFTNGWITVRHHPYIFPDYVCNEFAADTFFAAYKGLGYGTLSVAYSTKHCYNVFWVGGNWQDLNNGDYIHN